MPTVDDLGNRLLEWFAQNGLSQATIASYRQSGINRIRKEYKLYGQYEYSVEFTDELVAKFHGELSKGTMSYPVFKRIRRCAVWLNEYAKTQQFTWSELPPWKDEFLNEYYRKLVDDYLCWENNLNRRKWNTIRDIKRRIECFFEYLQNNKCEDISGLTPTILNNYLPLAQKSNPRGMSQVIGALKILGEYLDSSSVKTIDIQNVLPDRIAKSRKVMPAFTIEEVQKMLSFPDRNTAKGKRDYAMLILAASTGLRTSDISTIKLTDINWKKSELQITQFKTQNPITQPFEDCVGNALADYILNARPKCDVQEIFVRSRAPIQRLNNLCLTRIVRHIMEACDINCAKGLGKGAHSLRRYLATALLNENVTYSTIRDILGHSQTNNLKSYIRANSKGLQTCALTLDGIETTQEDLA